MYALTLTQQDIFSTTPLQTMKMLTSLIVRGKKNTMPGKIALFVFFLTIFADSTNGNDGLHSSDSLLEERLYRARMKLWSRGSDLCDIDSHKGYTLEEQVNILESATTWSPLRLGPVRKGRRDFLRQDECIETNCPLTKIRGGAMLTEVDSSSSSEAYSDRLKKRLQELGTQFGQEFTDAIEKNEKEHKEDCEVSCESYYCAPKISSNDKDWDPSIQMNGTSFINYSFGATPPEDFFEEFGFPLDLMKVTKDKPLFSSEEAAHVISLARAEGIEHNEYRSGKYQLGGDWLTNLPKTREWFNIKLKTTLFPLMKHLFPEIVSSSSVLRAHSVSLLKYNTSHPRTDVHVDNGILAMTLAMTPQNEYVGGGTFFEHMGVDNVLAMDVGHGTFRPGSVRHGGHKVTDGTRYILGAFLLIEDRVEHVRRLKNRGSEMRRKQNLEGAAKHFEWALAINPKCTTCLKDWAEILLTQKRYDEAEEKIREVLTLLEEKDSDALFSLGVILSEAGKDDASIDAYTRSVKLNAEDAELCYNLGIKLGAKGDTKAEMAMYYRATTVDPKFGGGWLNWGTALAESGNFDDAEVMFLKAMECPEVAAKAMLNLGHVYQNKAERFAAGGNLMAAKDVAVKAGDLLDSAKGLLDAMLASGASGDDDRRYAAQFGPLRLQCYRIMGSIFAGMKDFASSEIEFRKAAERFPHIKGAWEMLARILEVQGKTSEAAIARNKLNAI